MCSSNLVSQCFDGNGCIFTLLADVPLSTSAYYNAGVLTTNYGTTLDSHYSTGITLKNFTVQSAIGNLSQPTLKIQDWHQACEISNIISYVSRQVLLADNCYYTTFDNIITTLTTFDSSGVRFQFENNYNLNKISRLQAGNAGIGYLFNAAVTATQLTNLSLEGQTIGIKFTGTVYDVIIENCYVEGITDSAIYFGSYVLGAQIQNNYVNFLNSATTYFVDYLPLPGSNVFIAQSNNYTNMPSMSNLIKPNESSYSQGITVQMAKGNAPSLSDYLIDNTKVGPNIDWRQKLQSPGFIGNVVNVYATGNYSGKFTSGYANANGFIWNNLSSTSLKLSTKIKPNSVQFVYVNISVAFSGGPTNIAGFFIGNQFYIANPAAGLINSTVLTGTTDANGFFEINGGSAFGGTLTGVTGEVRLV